MVERADGYCIRRAQKRDTPAIVELYRSILNPAYSTDWFEWKYADNPHADEMPVVVATAGDAVVGAGGFVPMRMHTGRNTIMAVQPCDAAVHPDHRRQGLYTDILGAGLDYYTTRNVAFAFDFPNRLSRGTFEKHGWRPVDTRPSFVRIQRPSGMLGHAATRLLDPVCPQAPTALTRIFGATGGRAATAAVELARVDGVPAPRLATLYHEAIPDAIHAYRDECFYEWRFANPRVAYRTYIATRDGQSTAAVITGRTRTGRGKTTYLTDVLPLPGGSARSAALDLLIDALLSDHADADLVVAPPLVPSAVRTRYGFLSDRRLPLSLVSQPTIHGVRPLACQSWVVDGQPLRDANAWTMTFAEFDTH